MRAGSLDRRITFERATVTTDGFGGETQTWTDHATVWASVTFGTGAERREAAQEVASLTATFQVRASPLIDVLGVKDRILFDGATWDITSNVPSRERGVGRDITGVRQA